MQLSSASTIWRSSTGRRIPNQLIAAIAVAAYFDLLFLPYFQLIIIPFSLPLVVLGILLLGRLQFPRGTHLVVALMVTMTLSVFIGIFLPHSFPYATENLKRLFQFGTSFFYLTYFYTVAQRYPIELTIRWLSLAFLIYCLSLQVLFLFDPLLIHAFMESIYGRLVTSEDVVLFHFRFAYLFTDPNTAGYFLLIAVLPWLFLYKSIIVRVIIIGFCLIFVFFVQSRGALLALILAVLIWLIRFLWIMFRYRKAEFMFTFKVVIIFFAVAVLGVWAVSYYFGDLPIFEMSLDRTTSEEAYRSGGSRPELWMQYVTSLDPLPWGVGYSFETPQGDFRPHSDLLRLVYSYGLISAVIFMVFLFRTARRYPLLLMPAFMPFAINSLIDEQKLFGLFLATLGLLLGMQKRYSLNSSRNY